MTVQEYTNKQWNKKYYVSNKSIDNKVIWSKGTTEKVINQKKKITWFIHKIWFCLSLMKNVLPQPAKNVLLPLGVIAEV